MKTSIQFRSILGFCLLAMAFLVTPRNIHALDVTMVDYPRSGGETDDQPRIMRAITAVTTNGGGRIYFPSQTYFLSNTLAYVSGHPTHCYLRISNVANIVLVGAGPATIFKSAKNASDPVFSGADPTILSIEYSTNVEVRSISFLGEGKSYPRDGEDLQVQCGVYPHNTKFLTVSDCYFKGVMNGIAKGLNSHSRFINNTFTAPINQDSIFMRAHSIASGNIVEGLSGQTNDVSMGIRLEGDHSVITGNVLANTFFEPIVVEGYPSQHAAIVGNVVRSGYYGIALRSMKNGTVVGNALDGGLTILPGEVGGIIGVQSNWPVEENVISANAIRATNGTGLFMWSTNNASPSKLNLLTGNSISDAPGHGLFVAGISDYTSLVGNKVIRPGYEGLLVSSGYLQINDNSVVNPGASNLYGNGLTFGTQLPGVMVMNNYFSQTNSVPTNSIALEVRGDSDAFVALNHAEGLASFKANLYGTSTNKMVLVRTNGHLGVNIASPIKTLHTPEIEVGP